MFLAKRLFAAEREVERLRTKELDETDAARPRSLDAKRLAQKEMMRQFDPELDPELTSCIACVDGGGYA